MTSPLNRNEVIELLRNLGSERDEEVLEAARQVNDRITTAGLTWEDLLRPDDGDGDHDNIDDTDGPNDGHTEDEAAEAPSERAKKDDDSLALINKLLARPGISDDFRTELQDYKTDIAAGDFEATDHRYIQALYKRLSKSA
jgi:hypothetical protein